MKSFEEFWGTLKEEDFSLLANEINSKNEKVINEVPREESLGYQVGMTSIVACKFILERYHKWLSEQD